MKNYSFAFLLCFILFTSCIPQKQLIYMQDHEQERGYENPYQPVTAVTEAYKVKPKDYLYIRVITPNEELSNLYNLTGGQGNTMNYSFAGSSKFISYLVNDEGNIDFPYIGNIAIAGLTLSQIKEKMYSILQKYMDTFTLQVQLTDNQYTILGEIKAPGQYGMSKDQLTLYEAVAIAGDLTVYGKRDQVKIMRPTETGTKTILVDLTDKNIIDSEQYYILPNDLIYIEPKRAKQAGISETFSFGVITTIISFSLLIISIL